MPQPAFETWLRAHFAREDRLLLADLNGDGKPDLLCYNRATGGVCAYLSDGRRFAGPEAAGAFPPGFTRLLAGDVNGDGRADLFGCRGRQVWLSRNVRGQLQPPVRVVVMPRGAKLLVGDLNGDGRVDLVIYRPCGRTLTLYRGAGEGTFARAARCRLRWSMAGAQVLLGDTNGDGRADLIAYKASRGLWEVLRSDGRFGLVAMPNRYGPWGSGRRRAFVADFDGNGKVDIAAFDPRTAVLDISLSLQPADPKEPLPTRFRPGRGK